MELLQRHKLWLNFPDSNEISRKYPDNKGQMHFLYGVLSLTTMKRAIKILYILPIIWACSVLILYLHKNNNRKLNTMQFNTVNWIVKLRILAGLKYKLTKKKIMNKNTKI